MLGTLPFRKIVAVLALLTVATAFVLAPGDIARCLAGACSESASGDGDSFAKEAPAPIAAPVVVAVALPDLRTAEIIELPTPVSIQYSEGSPTSPRSPPLTA